MSKKSQNAKLVVKPLFEETVDTPLFCVSFNPEGPFYVKGFVDGQVVASSYKVSSNGEGKVETLWSTKRHKGSCRALTYDQTGKCE